mmetsp:Transcript_12988/g.43949  ORF Transcript_12988/g.43949 Transcript_12988/m.43949 type:complete len:256 (+) Transcript_12988:489-1256(+)
MCCGRAVGHWGPVAGGRLHAQRPAGLLRGAQQPQLRRGGVQALHHAPGALRGGEDAAGPGGAGERAGDQHVWVGGRPRVPAPPPRHQGLRGGRVAGHGPRQALRAAQGDHDEQHGGREAGALGGGGAAGLEAPPGCQERQGARVLLREPAPGTTVPAVAHGDAPLGAAHLPPRHGRRQRRRRPRRRGGRGRGHRRQRRDGHSRGARGGPGALRPGGVPRGRGAGRRRGRGEGRRGVRVEAGDQLQRGGVRVRDGH